MKGTLRNEVLELAAEARQLLDSWRPGTITQQDLGRMRDALSELEMLDQVPTNRPDFIALAKQSLGLKQWTARERPHQLHLAIYAVMWCACRDNANYDLVRDDRVRWAKEELQQAWKLRDQVAA